MSTTNVNEIKSQPYKLTDYDCQRLGNAYDSVLGFNGDPSSDPLTIKCLAKGYIVENPEWRAEEDRVAARIAELVAQYGPGDYSVGVGNGWGQWILTDAGKEFVRSILVVGDERQQDRTGSLVSAKRENAATNRAKSHTQVASVAHDQVEFEWKEQRTREYYGTLMDASKRVSQANLWLADFEGKGYTRAQAQFIVIMLIKRIHSAGANKAWMSNFSEKMREDLNAKLSSFGEKAHPLTDKQFEAAVKAAW